MDTIAAVRRNGNEPLRDQVLRRCRTLLMSGHFMPGQKLPLRPLADEFNTSLMPVRDALNVLVADGALELTRGRTICVPKLNHVQVVELHEIRSSLEGLAASHAADNISKTAIDRAEQLMDEMEQAFLAKDYGAYIDAHFSFHFTIYGASERPTLFHMIEGLWLQLGPSFRQGIEKAREIWDREQKTGDPNHSHRRVISALRSRDVKATRDAIERDVMAGIGFYKSGVWPTEKTVS